MNFTNNTYYTIKVCSNFNTIEWVTEEPNAEEIQRMYDIISSVHVKEQTQAKPAVSYATERQKACMKGLGIQFDDKTTKQEAIKLIKSKLG